VDGLGLNLNPDDLPGESLLALDGGGLASDRGSYVIDYGSSRGRWIAVRSQRFKFVKWASGGYEELYDLVTDPDERCNLATERRDITDLMRDQALAWEREHGLAESFAEGRFRTYP